MGTDFQSYEIEDTLIGPDLLVFTYHVLPNQRTYWERYYGKYYADAENTYLYFIEETELGYRIKFGNGVFGRSPIVGERIDFEIFVCPFFVLNDTDFTWVGGGMDTSLNLGDTVDIISAATVTDSTGYSTISINGSEKETIEEIKFNAPRANRAQEHKQKMTILLSSSQNPKLIITVIGGDKLTPKQLGKVFETVKPNLAIHPDENFSTNNYSKVLKIILINMRWLPSNQSPKMLSMFT